MTRTKILATLSLLLVAAACGKKASEKQPPPPPPPPPAIDAGSAVAPIDGSVIAPVDGGSAVAPADAGSAASAGDGGAAVTAPSAATTAVAEGTTCPAGTTRVTNVPITIDGARLSFKRTRGGGCRQRAVYTAHYAKANPTPILVCYDPDADPCEKLVVDESVTIDLTAALVAAGATSAVLAR